jgi:hypothetical protein
MINPSKFVKIIRQKVLPQPHNPISNIEKTEQLEESEDKEDKVIPIPKGGTRYIGIANTDMEQRVQHTIRNLMELDIDELAYIEDMNCKNMFEIVKLLNNVVSTLVENMIAIDS